MNKASRIINKTIADYNLIAHKFSSTRAKLSQDLISLAKKAGESDQILDYGCGNGRLCRLFDPEHYLGLDASGELIKIAQDQNPGYIFKLIKPCEVPKENKYDVIFCLAMIHHLPDYTTQSRLLSDFADIINPKGRLILTAWQLDESNSIVSKSFTSGDLTIQRQIFSFSQKNLETLVKSAGLKIISSKILPRNRGVYSNLEIIAQKLS